LMPRGHTVSPFSFVVYNDGSSDFSGSVHYTVRLSTNKSISILDPSLATGTITVAKIGAKESVILTPTISIPSTTAYGDYYMGVTLNEADSDASDNTTGIWDVAGISIY